MWEAGQAAVLGKHGYLTVLSVVYLVTKQSSTLSLPS